MSVLHAVAKVPNAIYSSKVASVVGVSEGTFRISGTVVSHGDDIRLADSTNVIRSMVVDIVDRSQSIKLTGKPIEDAVAGLQNLGAHLGIENRAGKFEVIGRMYRPEGAPATPHRIYVDGKSTLPAGAERTAMHVDEVRFVPETEPSSGGFIPD